MVDDWTSVRHLKDDRQIYVVQCLGADDNDTKSCDTQEQLFSLSESKGEFLNLTGLNQTNLKIF